MMVYSRDTEKILSFEMRTRTRLGSGNTGSVRECYGSIEPAYPDERGKRQVSTASPKACYYCSSQLHLLQILLPSASSLILPPHGQPQQTPLPSSTLTLQHSSTFHQSTSSNFNTIFNVPFFHSPLHFCPTNPSSTIITLRALLQAALRIVDIPFFSTSLLQNSNCFIVSNFLGSFAQ